MCGRFTLRARLTDLARQFGFALPSLEVRLRVNISPTQDVLTVRRLSGQDHPAAALLQWGLVPGWADSPKIGFSLINARGETVATKPSFRSAFKRRRCLILADGFYEWQKVGKTKIPQWIRLRDGSPFAFAGLWETWRGKDAKDAGDAPPLETCTIVTTDANALTKPFHDRMPVILDAPAWPAWLDPDNDDVAELQDLLRAYPVDRMQVTPANPQLNSSRFEPGDIDPTANIPADTNPEPGMLW